jgi:hypothetical protein
MWTRVVASQPARAERGTSPDERPRLVCIFCVLKAHIYCQQYPVHNCTQCPPLSLRNIGGSKPANLLAAPSSYLPGKYYAGIHRPMPVNLRLTATAKRLGTLVLANRYD